MPAASQPPFSLGARSNPLRSITLSAVERALGLAALNDVYAAARHDPLRGGFAERSLAAAKVGYEIVDGELASIPATGPLLVVANHPLGGAEGLISLDLLQRVRPDVRLLANFLLGRMPEMHDLCFFVDPFGGPGAARRNMASTKSALRWLEGGGLLAMFPAGEVSHLTWRNPRVVDPRWSDGVARITQRTGCGVLPIFFEGRNSALFQLAGLIHPRLRTLLLPHELLRRANTRVRVRIGSVIPARRLEQFPEPRALTTYLRVRTYLLGARGKRGAAARPRRAPLRQAPLAAPQDAAQIAGELAALPAARRLAASGAFDVLIGRRDEIPTAVLEIGRLRELTFRAAGEGTGRSFDLDEFDDTYQHLLVWHREARQIVGAYRLGATDEILPQRGVGGLYTSTLFRYSPGLLARLGPALEAGRSLVITEYQRDFSPLMLLWKGLGRLVCTQRRYRWLFGAVSIADDYDTMTKRLLMAFLESNQHHSELAPLVTPRNPPRLQRLSAAEAADLAVVARDAGDVEDLVRELEHDRRGMPVLLRQYLRLGARLLGFNVDPAFGDVLDGLVLIDLPRMNRAILDRYLGPDADEFVRFHGLTPPARRGGERAG